MKPSIILSIIICTCNRAEHLRQTLIALAGVCVPKQMSTELLIIDNASTDHTAEVVNTAHLSPLPIRYIYEKRRGQCHARNRGIAEAEGQIILFTDDDVRPPKRWIEEMCEPILTKQADAVAGQIRMARELERPWMKPMHMVYLADTRQWNSGNLPNLIGANMAFSKDVLARVPQFDVEIGPGALGFSDDYLFSQQLKAAGFRIVSPSTAPVEHHFDETRLLRSNFLERMKREGMSTAYVAYHWEHRKVHRPWVELVKSSRRLAEVRLRSYLSRKYKKKPVSKEGCSEWEMRLVQEIYFYRQFLAENKRPRNYEKYGLIKLS